MAVNDLPKSWQRNVPLAPYTTLRVGGLAEYFVSVESLAQLRSACGSAREREIPVTVLGGGSNVLISDHGLPGLVIQIAIEGVQTTVNGDTVRVRAGAGVNFDAVVAQTVAHGWWGLENLSAIPGTVGATPVQNVGAYGVEVAQVIESVVVYHYSSDTSIALSAEELEFSYRHSVFKTPHAHDWIITEVNFLLSTEPSPQLNYADLSLLRELPTVTPQLVREHVRAVRAKKFPDWQRVGTAGSFFKNPIIEQEHYKRLKTQYPDLPGYQLPDGTVKVSLGWILDHICDLRGYTVGAVGLYERQALVLLQTGGATGTDIKNFATKVSGMVAAATDIDIELEVTLLPRKSNHNHNPEQRHKPRY